MFKIFSNLKRNEWLQILASLVFIVVQVWLDLKMPDYMNNITKLVQTEGSTLAEIWQNGLFMLLCSVGSLASSLLVGLFATRVATSFSRNLRSRIYNKVQSFSMEEINRFSTASLITRNTNDINQVQMVIGMGMQVVVKAPITAVWAFTKIIGKAWQWTMLTGISILFLLALISVLLLFVFPTFKRIQTLTDNLNQITRENLIGIRVVRAYNAEHFAQNQFGEANEELTNAHLFTGRMMAVQMPGMSLIMNGMSLGIYWIGAYLINAAVIGTARLSLFGDMVVYNNYAMQLVMSFMSLIMIFNMLPRAAISARRINEVLDTEPVILDGTYVVPDPKVKEAAKLDEATKASLKKSKGTKDELVFLDDEPNRPLLGEVEFKNVNFKYPGASEYVLRDVNFKAKPGDVIAFIGSTGSGKSTIANLIPRLYEVTDGEVLVDGVNVKEYKQDDLHNKIGFISQRAVIFSGTITSNVAYGDNGGKEPTEEEIIKAVEIAQGKDFVEKMPDKYESAISQGGLNISGGQKQRVAIARAVVRKPEIFIFDDSFSALDYQTDRDLRTALKKETNNATCVIVAQRISTIREADTIIVLEQGEVVGNGTHEQLLKDCEVYKEIAYSQLTEEELTHAS